jgi:hypothetical protein
VVSEFPPRAVIYNSESMGELSAESDSRDWKCQNFQVTFSRDVSLIFACKPSDIVEFKAFMVMKILIRII